MPQLGTRYLTLPAPPRVRQGTDQRVDEGAVGYNRKVPIPLSGQSPESPLRPLRGMPAALPARGGKADWALHPDLIEDGVALLSVHRQHTLPLAKGHLLHVFRHNRRQAMYFPRISAVLLARCRWLQ